MLEILMTERRAPSHFISLTCRLTGKIFLFDTCASHSIVSSKSFAPAVKDPKVFHWLDPQMKLTSQGSTTLELDFGQKHSISWQFDVLDKVSHNLCGMDFMTFYNVSLNAKSKTVSFNNDVVIPPLSRRRLKKKESGGKKGKRRDGKGEWRHEKKQKRGDRRKREKWWERRKER